MYSVVLSVAEKTLMEKLVVSLSRRPDERASSRIDGKASSAD